MADEDPYDWEQHEFHQTGHLINYCLKSLGFSGIEKMFGKDEWSKEEDMKRVYYHAEKFRETIKDKPWFYKDD